MSRFLSVAAAIAASTLLLSSPASAQSDVCNGDDYGTAGQFDFYVLEFSWPAQFCSSHTSYPGCITPTAWQQTNFTLHGLWPNYNAKQGSHDWPQCCDTGSGANLDPTVITNLLPSLQTYWPSEQDPTPSGGDLSDTLWAHEWAKHGTCSGLDQTTYFNDAMSLIASPYLATPSVITSNIGGTANTADIIAAFNNGEACDGSGSCLVGLSCSGGRGNEKLSGLITCWDPSLKQVVCPKETLGRGCSDATVTIDSFSSSAKMSPAEPSHYVAIEDPHHGINRLHRRKH